ncbi:MAG TPA: ferritin-like domain-containing protein [Turneriella sp.]|nr:ferritin-like domain-containing protein [Turneriella sp.]HMY11301.1 ferritin-like domain-containing protein [Turneriella sp.]HNA79892.1 ferritin-like domain-containing protein [Turneriella sp.]HNE21032.1 ferritin-like domain-containing protein [Turneriella sp.]HNN01564.1 ferritin-like domain-containing protein [Turneriella sp.]
MEITANITTLGNMVMRNPKVAAELFPSAIAGYVLQQGHNNTLDVVSGHAVHYDWTYSNFGNPEFKSLYRRAYKGQWDAEDLPWDTNVDPFNPNIAIIPERLVPGFGEKFYPKDLRDRQKIQHAAISFLLSQFLHGEQGALYIAGETVEASPWFDAKLYGSTQVVDEGRHVEVFARYLQQKLEKLYHVNDNLFVILRSITAGSDWDLKFLGMQIMIEGLALGAFGTLYKFTEEPLLKQLLKQVISDEARHVHYGVVALRDYFTKEISEAKRREREDWAYEVAIMLRNRFHFLEIHEEFYGQSISRKDWLHLLDTSEMMSEFRKQLFTRMIPNLKAIGLLSDRIRPKYAQLGILKYENERSADHLTAEDLMR